MGNHKLSIIIPVYNVVEFLEKCLNSLVNQTYENLEIIIIDDGSTDGSSDLCDEIAKKNNQIIVRHQVNKGVSAARNLGLNIASGEYITFVDSDDYIDTNTYEFMMKKIDNEKQYDILIFNYIMEKGKKSNIKINQDNVPLEMNSNEFLYYLLRDNFLGFCWNKIYKKRILKNVRFHEDIDIIEDLLFNCEISKYCNNVYYENKPFYHYVIRENSALKSEFSTKNISSIIACGKILHILKERNSSLVETYELQYLISSKIIMYQMKKYNLMNTNIMKEIQQTNKEILNSGIWNKKANIKLKIKAVILVFFPNLYCKIKKV